MVYSDMNAFIDSMQLVSCNRPLAIFVCAPPGAGKGTTGKAVTTRFPEISLYDSGAHMRAQKLVQGPNLVDDDEKVFAPFRAFLRDTQPKVVWVDGVLRRVSQGKIVYELHAADWATAVIYINVPVRACHQRMLARAALDESRRDELNYDFRYRRLQAFAEHWTQLVSWLDHQRYIGYANVNGSGDKDTVFGEVCSALYRIAPLHFRIPGAPPAMPRRGTPGWSRVPLTQDQKDGVTVPSFNVNVPAATT